MYRIAIFPGSYDPITVGHVDIVKRALPLFDKIIVAIGINSKKKYLFSLEQRMEWIDEIFKKNDNVEVKSFEGLTVDFCKKEGAKYILRGARTATDFEFEKTIGQLNQSLNPDLETIIMLTRPEFGHISSTIVREIIINNGDYGQFVPSQVSI